MNTKDIIKYDYYMNYLGFTEHCVYTMCMS